MTPANTSSIDSEYMKSTKSITPPQTTSQICDYNKRGSKTSILKPLSRVSLLNNSQSPQLRNQSAFYSPKHSTQIPNQLILRLRDIPNTPPPSYYNAFYSPRHSNQISNNLIAALRDILNPLPPRFYNLFYPAPLSNQIHNQPIEPFRAVFNQPPPPPPRYQNTYYRPHQSNQIYNRPTAPSRSILNPPPPRYQNTFYPSQQSNKLRLQSTALFKSKLIISPQYYPNLYNVNLHEPTSTSSKQDAIQSQSTTQESSLIHNGLSPPQHPLLNPNAKEFILPKKSVKQDQPQPHQKVHIPPLQSKLNLNATEFVLPTKSVKQDQPQMPQKGNTPPLQSKLNSNAKEFSLLTPRSSISKSPPYNQINSNSSQQSCQNIPKQGPSFPQISEIHRAMIQSSLKSREYHQEEFPLQQPNQVHYDIPEYKLFPENDFGYAKFSPFSENKLKEKHSDQYESKQVYHTFLQKFRRHKLNQNESNNAQTTNAVYEHLGNFPHHLCRPNAAKKLNMFFKKIYSDQSNSITPPDDINNNCSSINYEILNDVQDGSNSNGDDEKKFKVKNPGL